MEFNKPVKLLEKDNIMDLDLLDELGVYVIADNEKNIIYIGKGGTVIQDGSFKKQTIAKRLKNIRDGKKADLYFKDMMDDNSYDKIYIYCVEKKKKKLPAYLEGRLIQEYYNKYNTLPKLNKTF